MDFRSVVIGLAAVIVGVSAPNFVRAETPTPTVNAGVRSVTISVRPPFHISRIENCVGFENGLSSNPTLQLSDCSSSISNRGWTHHQKWTWVGISKNVNGEWDTFAFRNTISNTCISVENNSVNSGAALVHQVCNYQNPSQLWMTTRQDVAWWGDTKLINIRSGKCAYPTDISQTTSLVQRDCVDSDNHWFEAILEQV